ncbi:MAG TPA: malto-oligosyltrehalose trehalohydrolase, partial [Longimicrobiaceae bacterium]|nr:malto-oligosyltrehalose trehalohydrolase [Longimicrobiaceae bacterium]
EMVIYELHVGTATPEGTFDALIERLDALVALGVTAVEVMPVADFPGERNWGYDGVYLFAPANAYGGPEAFRRLVDAAHGKGLAVLLDVVYNHFGPEGNYLPAFSGGRIFTEQHHTPWGAAVNYDAEGSAAVRDLIVQNALHWVHEYHVDGLRLDATHAILDDSPVHILQELAARLRASVEEDRHLVLIAEDERNERLLVTPVEEAGLGLDAVWADDFHHQVRRLTARDSEGYFRNYSGTTEDLVATLRQGWFYEGQYYPGYEAPRGTPAEGLPPARFVHVIQNHDQVGNRAFGERLNHQVESAVYRAASALLLLSPYTPLLWMGQEWAASSPFLYFTDHPEELGRLVTAGRREEFKHFSAFADPSVRERIPDPQAPETFLRSKLRWEEREEPPHAGVLRLYRELLALRRTHPALQARTRDSFEVAELGENGLALRRSPAGGAGETLLLVCCFRDTLRMPLEEREETRASTGSEWDLLLSTEEGRFGSAESGEIVRLHSRGELELRGAGAVL